MVGTTVSMALEMNGGNETEILESFRQPTFASVIFIAIGFVGTIGNALVCIVIASTLAWSRSGTTNLLILNQAAVDATTSFILILSNTLPEPAINKGGGWSEFVCRMWVPNSLLWMLFVVSTFNLCMMSLERYFAVAYPVIYSTKFKKQTSLLMILFCWIIAPLLHYYYPIAFDYNDAGVCRKRGDPLVVATIGVMIFVWEFFIPFIIMAVAYIRIVHLLRKQQRRVRAANTNPGHPGIRNGQPSIQFQPQPNIQVVREQNVSTVEGAVSGHHNQGGQAEQRRRAPSETVRRNVTVTLLAVFIMYVVCWMPNHLTFLQFGLGGPLNLSGAWYYTTLILAYLNMSINPFIYALKYKLFREGFKRLFCGKCYSRLERRNFTEHSSMPPRPIPTVSGSDRS